MCSAYTLCRRFMFVYPLRGSKSPLFKRHFVQTGGWAEDRPIKTQLASSRRPLHFPGMIASLMMYARPELDVAHASFWQCLRAACATRGIEAPEKLAQSAGEFAVWEDPTLVLSQTCGMPYRTRLRDKVQLVLTPDYGLDGCPPGYYRSALVVRAQDPRRHLHDFADATLAYNMRHSQSGFAALYAHAERLGFWFTRRTESGGHACSARMVAQGAADIAAIDAQTWRLLQRYEPWAAQLRVLDYTAPTPGLPYITGTAQDRAQIAQAVREGFSALSAQNKALLDLRGFVDIPQSSYLAVPNPPQSACA
jgi:hypothetical protein